MSKTETRQYVQKRYDSVNKEISDDVSVGDERKYFLRGQLKEIQNFASKFGVKLKKK